MQRQNYPSEEEYQQFLAYQYQQTQQSAYTTATHQQGFVSQHPGQYQNYAQPSASGHAYPAGYEGGKYNSGIVSDNLTDIFIAYHQPGTGGFPPATTSQGGYTYPQTQGGQFGQPSGDGTAEMHLYRALPSTPQSTIDTYISIIQLPESEGDASGSQASARSRRAYVCKWKGCSKAANNDYFKSKDNARVHVHKHFGSDKLFECVVSTCRKQFASEDAAKRHRDTTDWKAFTCALCQHAFARKDYRDWHQSRCRQ